MEGRIVKSVPAIKTGRQGEGVRCRALTGEDQFKKPKSAVCAHLLKLPAHAGSLTDWYTERRCFYASEGHMGDGDQTGECMEELLSRIESPADVKRLKHSRN